MLATLAGGQFERLTCIEAVAEAKGALDPLHLFQLDSSDHFAVVLPLLCRHLQPVEELPPFDPSFPLIEVDQLAQQALQPAAEASRADGVGIDIHDLLFFGFRLR